MKKLLINIVLFFVFVAIVDCLFGFAVDDMFSKAKDGEKAKLYYLVNEMNEDVVIMGSSRAYRHYNPKILEDSLSMRVYNAGCSSMGIICNYGFYKAMVKNHKPKLIVYELYKTDFEKDDYTVYLDNLRTFRKDKDIKEYVAGFDENDKYKMLSSLYCYNTKWVYIVQENIRPSAKLDRGYQPYKGVIKSEPSNEHHDDLIVDNLKIDLLKNYIIECKKDGIELVFIISPLYNGKCSWLDQAKLIADEYDVSLFDYSSDNSFVYKKELFADQVHLNEDGANLFTQRVAVELKRYRLRLREADMKQDVVLPPHE